jgi:hypothetical protein
MIQELASSKFLFFCRYGLTTLLLLTANVAVAQNIPSAAKQEVLIRSTLATFNDANLSGDYSVMDLLSSKPFREQVGADKLKSGFKEFADKHLDLAEVVVAKLMPTKATTVDGDGVMTTEGYLDLSQLRLHYTLKHILSDAQWKLIDINVTTDELPK